MVIDLSCIYPLILITMIATYGNDAKCTYTNITRTLECNYLLIEKLETGKYPVNATSLQDLYINNGRLKELEYNVFDNYTDLEELDLTHNLIEELDCRLFLKLQSLMRLRLGGNRIHMLTDGRLFEKQRSLTHLELSLNRLVYVNSSVLEPLKALRDLNLSDNPFHCDCELWKTIIICKDKGLEPNAACINPIFSAWSTWTRENSSRECPFRQKTSPDLNIVLIVGVLVIVICVIVCIALTFLLCYYRRRRSNKVQVIMNPSFENISGISHLHDNTFASINKSYLSVIPEGTEISRSPSRQFEVDSNSAVYEELDGRQSILSLKGRKNETGIKDGPHFETFKKSSNKSDRSGSGRRELLASKDVSYVREPVCTKDIIDYD
ncbi:hypothetical protein C0J52_12112 [Blattella germanica]|nr:hypothetical protein C0J52_12112 [Blattella germanica]